MDIDQPPKRQKGNFEFYSAMELAHFERFADLTGFDSGVDIEIIFPYVKDAHTLVELGAGYGRAIHFLLEKGFRGKIVAVERIEQLAPRLEQRFGKRIEIQQQDITELSLPEKADCIIWLWSGILELDPEEQKQSVQQVFRNLEVNGIFIIESPYQTVEVVGKLQADRKVTLETDWGKLEAYLPTEEEIEAYATQAGFSEFSSMRYQSTVGLERVFYLLKK